MIVNETVIHQIVKRQIIKLLLVTVRPSTMGKVNMSTGHRMAFNKGEEFDH